MGHPRHASAPAEEGRIVASYATGAVVARTYGGGIVGQLLRGDGTEVAGSYSERHAAGEIAVGLPRLAAGSRTTADLLGPSAYEGIYRDWNMDLDGDGEPDDPWSLEAGRYPAIKIDADGEAVTRQFGAQRGPTGVAVGTSETDADEIVVTWDEPRDAGEEITRYELQRRVDDGPFVDVDPPHVGTGTSFADSAPTEGTAHTYRIRAVTPIGATQWSPPVSTAPGPPRVEVELGSGRATVTWSPPDDTGTSPVTGYQYQLTADGGDTWDPAWIEVPNDEPETRSFEVDGLTNALRYGFEVRAVNASGSGAGSERATVVGTPGPPRDLSATPGEHRVTLRWSPPGNPGGAAITGYQFRQSADGGGTWAPDWIDLPDDAVESHVVQGVANATRHVFEVRAVNMYGPGAAARVDAHTPPILVAAIPNLEFPALADGESLHLGRFFAVVPGGTLTYTAVAAAPTLVHVEVAGDVLVVTPNDIGEDGETTVTVKAVDGEGRLVETTFAVTVDPLRGWWRRWGADVVAELRTDDGTDR